MDELHARPAVPGNLRWRCRRGMLELDALLGGWLDSAWSDASPARQAAFARLLECEDDRLWDWIVGNGLPEDPEMVELIHELRAQQGASG
ncbi:MAG: succinate dehydrogenase assembly factor 2 [Wenzhouxiangellaceae bacterium]